MNHDRHCHQWCTTPLRQPSAWGRFVAVVAPFVVGLALAWLIGARIAYGAPPRQLSGLVIKTYDADTITLRLDDDQVVRVRLLWIDAPEVTPRQEGGIEARDFATRMALGKRATVRWSARDRYGRLLGDVLIDGASVNERLVKAGHAWVYRDYAHPKALEGFEAKARKSKAGLWAADKPIAPWEFRRRQKAKR